MHQYEVKLMVLYFVTDPLENWKKSLKQYASVMKTTHLCEPHSPKLQDKLKWKLMYYISILKDEVIVPN